MGLRLGRWAGQLSSSTPNLSNHVFMNLDLYTFFPKLFPQKIGPYPSTSQLAQCSQLVSVLLSSTKPRLTHQTAKQRSVIHHSTEHIHCSRVQWWRVFHHSIPRLDVRLACSFLAIKSHSIKLPQHSFVLILMPVEVWISLAMESAEYWRFYAPQHLLTPLCDFTVCGLSLHDRQCFPLSNNTTYSWPWKI